MSGWCVCVSGLGVLGTGAQLCDLCVTVPARLCSGVSVPVDPCATGVGFTLATQICCCVHSLLASGTCLHLRVFVRGEQVCVCLCRMTVARAEHWRPVHLRAL